MRMKYRIRKIEEKVLKRLPPDDLEKHVRTLVENWVKKGLMKGPVTEEKVTCIKNEIRPPFHPHLQEGTEIMYSGPQGIGFRTIVRNPHNP